MAWEALPHQAEFFSLPDSIKEGFFGGTVGPGKSEALMMLPIVRGFYKLRGFKGILLRRTMPEHEREMIPRSKEVYPLFGAEWVDKPKSYWRWPEYNSYLFFGHCKDKDDIKKYDGVQWNLVMFDELTSFLEFQYTYMLSRCRSGHAHLPSIMRSASMPGNIGHTWVRKRFIEPAPSGKKIIVEKFVDDVDKSEYTTKRIFIPATIKDNPHILKNSPDYIASLQVLPENERRAKIHGDWWAFTGQVFSDFRAIKQTNEPDNALHVIEPFDIPYIWPRVCAIDWGVSAKTVAYFGAVAPEGRLIVEEEYWSQGTKVSTWGTEIGAIARSKNLVASALDNSAWDTNPTEDQTVYQQFCSYAGFEPEKASKARVSGKTLIQEYLRFLPKPNKNPIYNEEYANQLRLLGRHHDYRKYIKATTVDLRPEILPKVLIFNTCKLLIDVIPSCVYNTDSTKKNQEDVKEFDGDDPYDAFRYLVKLVDRYIKTSGVLIDKLKEKQKELDALHNDINDYAMMQRNKVRNTIVVPSRAAINRFRRLKRAGLVY